MAQRLKSVALVLAILVFGVSLIVAVTEYGTGVDAAGPRLLDTSDVIDALEDQDIHIASGAHPAHHPLLGIAGMTLAVNSASIEVYTYPSVTARVADEQIIQRHLMQLQALTTGEDPPLRVTSARNVLLLYHAESDELAASIHAAARSLATVAES